MFIVIDKRIPKIIIYTPKTKFTFRRQKLGIQEFHKKYVLFPADRAAKNIVVVWWLHHINILKQELSGTKAYKETWEAIYLRPLEQISPEV